MAHDWLIRVVDKCNLGPFFTRWIDILYRTASSQVIVNHSLSEPFQVQRGVRQGDPLSAILYILQQEPILNKIRADNLIKPVTLRYGKTRKTVGYADDFQFLCTQYPAIDRILDHFKYFGKASGSEINIEKTKVLGLGSWKCKNPPNAKYKVTYVKQTKIFGLFWLRNFLECGKQNFEDALKHAAETIPRLFIRNASIFGRATLINMLIESKFIYPLQFFDPNRSIFKKYWKLIRPFIHSKAIHGIADATLCLPKEDGGVGLHDLKLKHVACRLRHVKDYLDRSDETRMAFAHFNLSFALRDVIKFDNKIPHCFNLNEVTPFYKNCIKLYNKHKELVKNTDKKLMYDKLNEVDERRENELRKQVTRLTHDDNRKHIFKLLHQTKKTTPKQKQTTHRLLYGVTPTLYYKHKNTGRHFPCVMCEKNIQESEEHIFWNCQSKLRGLLIRDLRLPINTRHRHLAYTAVFLNLFPYSNPLERDYRSVILGIYREILWTARCDTRYQRKYMTSEHMITKYLGKVKHALSRNFSLKDIETISALNVSQYERMDEMLNEYESDSDNMSMIVNLSASSLSESDTSTSSSDRNSSWGFRSAGDTSESSSSHSRRSSTSTSGSSSSVGDSSITSTSSAGGSTSSSSFISV